MASADASGRDWRVAAICAAVIVVIAAVPALSWLFGTTTLPRAQELCTGAFMKSCASAGELPSVWKDEMNVEGSARSCGQLITCRCLKEANGSYSAECVNLSPRFRNSPESMRGWSSALLGIFAGQTAPVLS